MVLVKNRTRYENLILRKSCVAPHRHLYPNMHFLRRDVIFGPPDIHLVTNWTKTLHCYASNSDNSA